MARMRPAPRLRSAGPAALLVGVVLAACATGGGGGSGGGGSGGASAKKPPAQWDDLVRRESKTLQNVYVRPNVEFTAYKRVRLEPVSVEFDKNWDPNRGSAKRTKKMTSGDIQRIRTDLGTAFRKVFEDTLARGGYPLVEDAEEDVLGVTASLVNVYVNAPDRASSSGLTHSYTMDAGRMTLFLELRDAVTGQVLARVVDTKQGSSTGRMEVSDSASNSTEAQAAFRSWATQLRNALDEVNGKAGQ